MERSIKQFETDRMDAVKIAARLLLASATTAPRVGGVGECTVHILDDECDIEDLCQKVDKMSNDNEKWGFFRRDAEMLRDIPLKYDEFNEKTMHDRIIRRLWPQFRSIYS